MIGERFERESYEFKARINLIRDNQPGICNTSILLTHKRMCPHDGCRPIKYRSMREINKHGLLEYNVDPCEEDSNLDIATRHTI